MISRRFPKPLFSIVSRPIVLGFFLAGFSLAGFGCGFRAPGPAWRYPTTTVTGRLTLSSQPIPDGWVTLEPFGATIGDQVIGRLDGEGRFRIEGAPIGPLQVRLRFPVDLAAAIAGTDPRRQKQLQILASPGSPLHITTELGKTRSFDFDLASHLGPIQLP